MLKLWEGDDSAALRKRRPYELLSFGLAHGVFVAFVGFDYLEDEGVADDVGAAELVELDAGDVLEDAVYFEEA